MTTRSMRSNLLVFLVPLAISAALIAAIALALGNEGGNPDAGLSDEARQAKYDELGKTSVAQHAEIVKSFVASGRSIASLPRVSSTVDYGDPAPTISEARSQANTIVRGRVVNQRFEADASASGRLVVLSTVSVTDWIKGAAPADEVVVEQEAGISLNAEGEYVLVVDDVDPPLQEGADVIVFAAPAVSGRARTRPWTSISISPDGSVQPSEYSNFSSEKGRPASDLVRTLRGS